MKFLPIIATTMLAALPASLKAQNPDPSGAWRLSSFGLGFTTGTTGTVWGGSDLETDDITLNPNGTFTISEGAGNWFFSDDFFYLALGDVQPAAITRDLDTFVFANAEVKNPGGGPISNHVGINVGFRLPEAVFARADVAGVWQILRQTSISFSDSLFNATGYNGVFHALETLVLNPNGTFTLTTESNTDPGDTDNGSFAGTWSVVGRGIRLSAGGETLDITNLSAGLDTFIDFRTELSVQGANTNFGRKVELGIKQPGTLTGSELVGRWGLTGMTIDVEDDLTNTYTQEFRGATFESGDVSLFADGSGIYRRTRSNDPGLPLTDNFTWQAVGPQLVVTGVDGDVFSFRVSAGKDFAVSLNIEDAPGGDTDAYDLFTLCRLPDAPGFSAARPGFDFSGTPRLCIVTTPGLFYQLQRSIGLAAWVDVGDPIEGDGTEKCLDDPAAPEPAAFYRWAIVGAPD